MAEVIVSRSEDGEQPKEKPKTDGESRHAESARRREAGEKTRRGEVKREQEAKKKLETRNQQPGAKPQIEIPFKDARKIAEVVTAVQDEKQVIISPEELANFKRILTDYGHFEAKAVEKMTAARIVVTAQELMKNTKIAQSTEISSIEFCIKRLGCILYNKKFMIS